jgi:sigma-B regulation protein RsbU (phosphoserine phosphatase)
MHETKRQLVTLGQLQRRLLPRTLPLVEGWQLAAYYSVGRWPGGDYYDFLPLPDGRLLLLIADASDQGAPSAAMVAMVRVVLHSCPLSSGLGRSPFCPLHDPVLQPPHVILGHLNQVLLENTLDEQFMTAFCAQLDPSDGTLHFSNAGHPAPLWWRAAEKVAQPLREAAGLPLGVEKTTYYHHKRIVMQPGDTLVLYSDGLLAAVNAHGDIFGCERLIQTLHDAAGENAAGIKAALIERFDDFLDGHEVEDDVTVLVVQRPS